MGSKQLPGIDRKKWKFQKKCTREGNRPARKGQLIFFFKRASVKCPVVAQTQGYHLVCIWSSLVKFQGGGVVLKTLCYVLEWICWVFVPGLPLSFKAQCLPQIERVLCVAARHVVAKTQGYHLAIIWYALSSRLMRKASLWLPLRQTYQIKSNGSSCIQEFLFEVRFYFSSNKGH